MPPAGISNGVYSCVATALFEIHKVLIDEIAQLSHSRLNDGFINLGIGESKSVVPTAVDEKRCARDKDYVMGHRLSQEFRGIHIFCKMNEDKKTTFRSVPAQFLGEMAVELFKHEVTFFSCSGRYYV